MAVQCVLVQCASVPAWSRVPASLPATHLPKTGYLLQSKGRTYQDHLHIKMIFSYPSTYLVVPSIGSHNRCRCERKYGKDHSGLTRRPSTSLDRGSRTPHFIISLFPLLLLCVCLHGIEIFKLRQEGSSGRVATRLQGIMDFFWTLVVVGQIMICD